LNVRRIGVVIPYFQREPGILSQALASIAAQDIEGFEVIVVVVDDASPSPPELELEAFAPKSFKGEIRVVKRPNGGPGAARNTGIEALVGVADYISLMDSDDAWAPHHLRLAAGCMDQGADLFFADFQGVETDRPPYLESIPESAALKAMSAADHVEGFEVRVCGEGAVDQLAALAASTFLAHLSTIMFAADRLGDVRSLLHLPVGEDHVFFLDLSLKARRVAFTLTPAMAMGQKGVKIYGSTHQWGTQADLLRRIYNLQKERIISVRAPWPPATQRALDTHVRLSRRTVAWLLLRQALRTRRLPMRVIRAALKADVASVLMAPVFAAAYLGDRRGNRLPSGSGA
jgi:succinoglycan biosynthesis protein ExoW